ncbi:unnamed protein product [Moneuplotes crassus]|uniref:Uncharacterized protein n=1 Tax=Euplotes crassus TaxID=5936 RepID=A0AAD1XT26_EUPCR|nr:unnamed protein product [Moneuplotes crassus]
MKFNNYTKHSSSKLSSYQRKGSIMSEAKNPPEGSKLEQNLADFRLNKAKFLGNDSSDKDLEGSLEFNTNQIIFQTANGRRVRNKQLELGCNRNMNMSVELYKDLNGHTPSESCPYQPFYSPKGFNKQTKKWLRKGKIYESKQQKNLLKQNIEGGEYREKCLGVLGTKLTIADNKYRANSRFMKSQEENSLKFTKQKDCKASKDFVGSLKPRKKSLLPQIKSSIKNLNFSADISLNNENKMVPYSKKSFQSKLRMPNKSKNRRMYSINDYEPKDQQNCRHYSRNRFSHMNRKAFSFSPIF